MARRTPTILIVNESLLVNIAACSGGWEAATPIAIRATRCYRNSMVVSLREFLRTQKAALRAEIEPLEAQLAQLRRELADVEKAEQALGPPPVEQAGRDLLSAWSAASAAATSRGVLREGSIKDFVVRVLSERAEGMSALDILAAINRRFGTDYPRTSLSPQLSRLKNEGILVRDGLVWRLAKEEGPEGEPTEPVSSGGG